MLYSQISTQLHRRGEMLLSGRIDELVAPLVFPMPVFLQSDMMILNTPEEAGLIFGLLRMALAKRGVVALRPQISAVDLPRAGRFRVWVDWYEMMNPTDEMHLSSVIYYCRKAETGLRFEMVNYARQPMPELGSQLSTLALSA